MLAGAWLGCGTTEVAVVGAAWLLPAVLVPVTVTSRVEPASLLLTV